MAVAKSFWAGSAAVWHVTIDKFKQQLGIEPEARRSIQHPFGLPTGPRSKPQTQQSHDALPEQVVPSSDTPTENASTKNDPSVSSELRQADTKHTLSQGSPSRAISQTDSWNPIQLAVLLTLARNWHGPSMYPPRGVIYVQGLVECVGPQAWITIDVKATYNPKTAEWASLNLAIRRKQKRRQVPLGGP